MDPEYIVVGSGPGGGTLAARLAEAGKRVLLLEAGGDPRALEGGDAVDPNNRMPDDYDVPVFHAISSENDAMKWDFFVRHYEDLAQQRKDDKFIPEKDGVLYPRVGALGGCSSHNAMIMVYPHNADWDNIASMTGDSSWSSGHMRTYFQKLENCHHRPFDRILGEAGINPSKHGWNGWLQTEKAIPESALGDHSLVSTIVESAFEALVQGGHTLDRAKWLLESQLDPNDWRVVQDNSIGVRYPPLTTRNHQRAGTRERVLDAQQNHGLQIETDALVTKVLFDESGTRAVGLEYLKGKRQYKAFSSQGVEPAERLEVHATKEVILSGGAFNTPQMLMLSGIGPSAHLTEMGIPVRADLPVGQNLQDRYEVGVVNKMNFPCWEVLQGSKFAKGDPQYEMWANHRKGVYTTNGAVLAVIKRSIETQPLPDLFCFALLGLFRGYFPGYSNLFPSSLNYLTWAILKAHTQNRAGEVKLRSLDPRDTPDVNFHYFEEGSDTAGEDLQAVVDGIKFARTMTKKLCDQGVIAEEELPGPNVQTDDELRAFVRNNAWGHHASCTCPIGTVLTTDFKVKGIDGLRVVDASVFPRIPGFFIVSAVYMIGEKAADVILHP